MVGKYQNTARMPRPVSNDADYDVFYAYTNLCNPKAQTHGGQPCPLPLLRVHLPRLPRRSEITDAHALKDVLPYIHLQGATGISSKGMAIMESLVN